MNDGVEFQAEVLGSTAHLLQCRIGERIVGVPPLRLLPGTEVHHAGEFGKIVLPRDVAQRLGLAPRARCPPPPLAPPRLDKLFAIGWRLAGRIGEARWRPPRGNAVSASPVVGRPQARASGRWITPFRGSATPS